MRALRDAAAFRSAETDALEDSSRTIRMDALGAPNALDGEFALMNSSDGGDVESLMCLLRSQVRQAGVHSLGSPGTALAAAAHAADGAHCAAGSSGLDHAVVAAAANAPANASGAKSESLEVCFSLCAACRASHHFSTAGARAVSCERSRPGCSMRLIWFASS